MARWNRGGAAGAVVLLAGGALGAGPGASPPGGMIELRYARFDPVAGLPPAPAALRAPAGNELYLVQFRAVPTDADRAAVRAAGGTIERYIPGWTHLVRMGPSAREGVVRLARVRAVVPYEVAYRLSEGARAAAILRDGGAARYSIECLRRGPEQQQALADLIRRLGGIVDVVTPDQYRMEATLTPEQLVAVAGRNEVSFIDEWGGPGGTDMDVVRPLVGAAPLLSGLNLMGQGVRGEIHDTGIVPDHEQWDGQAPLIHTGTNIDDHGTGCYGVNFATGAPPGMERYTGLLSRREQGIFFFYELTTQFGATTGYSRLMANTEATDPLGPYRSCFQTSSVGSDQIDVYTTVSAEVDDYLFRVDYLSCQSQSNTGTRASRPQAWAKNIVSVGGIHHSATLTREDDAWNGASFGPAQEGRQKPDLAAPWENVYTTKTFDPHGYGEFTGTSVATPIVAGTMGLVMQMWHGGVWSGFGGGASVFADRPRSTTAKALVIASAYRYYWAEPAPVGEPIQPSITRDKQGWGMPDLAKLYGLRDRTVIVNADRPLAQGETARYRVVVAPGEPGLYATMCYIDPMGSTTALVSRVNDLTLRVIDPSGVEYWGNHGLNDGNWSTPGGEADTINTVENVFIQAPAPGVWTVEVIGSEIVEDGYGATPGVTDAVYSLVVLGATAESKPCYANCDGGTVPPILNVNDFNCFVNRYAAGDPYANCDGSTVPPILNVNDFNCFVNRYAAGCP